MLLDKSNTMDKDTFFRTINRDWYEDYNGDVDDIHGWYGLVIINPAFRADWEAAGEEDIPDNIDDGTYLVRINSDGIICAYQEESAILTQEAFNAINTECAQECDVDVEDEL